MKASDWISVKDRLPKYGERVLVCQTFDDGLYVSTATRVSINRVDRWYVDDGFDIDFITHWQKIVLPKIEKL